MVQYLIRLVQIHESFRRPEIEALARYSGVEVENLSYAADSPFCIVRLHAQPSCTQNHGQEADLNSKVTFANNQSDNAAQDFISRSILAKGIYELWGQGNNYSELHSDIKLRTKQLWSQYKNVSFKFSIDTYYGKRSSTQQRAIINSFSYLGFEGKISMTKADEEFVVFEEWNPLNPEQQTMLNDGSSKQTDIVQSGDDSRRPKRLYFGRVIGLSRRRLAEKHDLKKRPYISTTSMDAELALVTANLALAGPGKLFLDPFVGTGGFMVAAAELGAVAYGSDIDGRSFRGKGHGIENGVGANFRKYGLQHLFGDCLISDLTNTPLRTQGISTHLQVRWVDGIICDPPYGVREGLKVLGKRLAEIPPQENDASSRRATHSGPFFVDGVPAHTLPGFIAPKKPYSFARMLGDILQFAACILVDGGRLAFWMPTANEAEEDFPTPLHPSLELKHVCVQSFNKWSRKLLVYERVAGDVAENSFEVSLSSMNASQGTGQSADQLNPFRKRYFQGFADSDKH